MSVCSCVFNYEKNVLCPPYSFILKKNLRNQTGWLIFQLWDLDDFTLSSFHHRKHRSVMKIIICTSRTECWHNKEVLHLSHPTSMQCQQDVLYEFVWLLRKTHCMIIKPNSKDFFYLISSKLCHIFQQVTGFFTPSVEWGDRLGWMRQWIKHCLSFVEMKGSQNKASLLYYFHNG